MSSRPYHAQGTSRNEAYKLRGGRSVEDAVQAVDSTLRLWRVFIEYCGQHGHGYSLTVAVPTAPITYANHENALVGFPGDSQRRPACSHAASNTQWNFHFTPTTTSTWFCVEWKAGPSDMKTEIAVLFQCV